MGALKLSADLRPLSDLKSGASEIVRQVTETGRAVVLTRHGRGVAVMLSLEAYEEMEERSSLPALRAAIKAADEDVASSRLSSQRDVTARFKARLEKDGL